LHIRRHLAATPLFKGIPDFRPTRVAMLRAETVEQLFEILDQVEQMNRQSHKNESTTIEQHGKKV
jgi:hypothetical protein